MLFLLAFIFQVVIAVPSDPFAAGQIIDLGINSQSFQQPESLGILWSALVTVVRLRNLMYSVLRVVQITKNNGTGWSGLGTVKGLVAGGILGVLIQEENRSWGQSNRKPG